MANPLEDLLVGNKVNVTVSPPNVRHPVGQRLDEPLLRDQPSGVEGEGERSAVGGEVSLQVLVQQLGELLGMVEVGAGGDVVAPGQLPKLAAALSSVQLVDRQLPHREGPARAHGRPDAPVWHAAVQCVRPDGHATKRSCQGGVVEESLVSHHLKLLVAASSEERCSQSEHGGGAQVGEALDDQARPSHLLQPHVVATLRPILRLRLMGD